MPRPDRSATTSATVSAVAAVTCFGVPYGVLARSAGFPWWLTVAMSMTVFAGSSQFAAISVLSTGGSAAAATLAGALLNTRYIATGVAAARAFPGGRMRRFLLNQLVVDESYALGVRAGTAADPDPGTMQRTGALIYAGWSLGSLAGALLGPIVGDPESWGADAAFPALFLATLWPLLADRSAVRAALVGATSALVLTPLVGPGLALAGAAVAGLVTYR